MGKVKNRYEIKIQGLTDGEHEFDFSMGNEFFQAFEQDLLQEGTFEAKVLLEKSTTMLRLIFHITGTARLTCDRSLDEFNYPINVRESYLFKFGSEINTVGDDMEVIPHGTTEINIAQHLFDFIALAIPIKKLHPRYEAGDEEPEDYIYVSGDNSRAENDKSEENKEAENVDPRWAALAALRNNKDN